MSIQCPLCAEQSFEVSETYFGHMTTVHRAAITADPVLLGRLIVAGIQYVRAASFENLATAQACARFLSDQAVDIRRLYDIAIVCAIWEGAPVVVVNATDAPPADIQHIVDGHLRMGTPWDVPLIFLQSLILRRLRQMGNQEGELQPNGARLIEKRGLQQRLDPLGRETPI